MYVGMDALLASAAAGPARVRLRRFLVTLRARGREGGEHLSPEESGLLVGGGIQLRTAM